MVRITATPNNGATYKLNYKLAYATPTFEGLSTFNVATYGAVGNGTDNDYEAIKNAYNAANTAGGGIIKFDGSKQYYVRGPQGYILFDFKETSNIKVEGNGSKIILHPEGTFMYIDSSENIQIDGFTTTYAPLPYFQGDILDINIEELYLDMQVDERFEVPVIGKYISSQEKFGRSFWNTVANTEMGDGRHLGVDSTAQIGNESHKLRIFLKDTETADLTATKANNATTFIAPHKDYSHAVNYRESYYSAVLRSSRVKISNILTQSICHFGYYVGSNYGPIIYSNTDILAPNEADMHVAWRDGWHVWGNRYGIMIEDGDFDAGFMYDDVFSPHMNVPIVESVSESTIRLKSKPGESTHKYTDSRLWLIGDLVSFWNDDQTVFHGMGRITSVSETSRSSLLDITIDENLDQVKSGVYAINEENINRDMVIRNSTTTPKGRRTAVRQRTPILYQNCDFQNIHFWTYMGESWRTRPRNVVFDSCTIFERQTFNVDDTWNLTIKNSTITGQVDVNNIPRLIIDNSTFSSLKLRDQSTAYVFGNTNNSTNYDKDILSVIHDLEPEEYPSYKPPFLIEKDTDFILVKEPFEITSSNLTNSGSGFGWQGDWTTTTTGINIKNDSSLEYIKSVELSSLGGQIKETNNNVNNSRYFEGVINMGSETFYLSFLARKDINGSFKLQTNNADNHIRFGVEVSENGTIGARSGIKTAESNSGKFQNTTTYFVVVKYSNSGGNSGITKMKLFKNGDQIPEDETDIDWDVESLPATTGVDQNRLTISIENGTVELDELIIGYTYKSIVSNETSTLALSESRLTNQNKLVIKKKK